MKYTQLQALEKHLQAASPNHYSPLYFVLSKDDFLRRKGIDLLKKHLGPGAEIITLEAGKATSKEIADELEGLPMFASRRLLILENGEKLAKEEQAVLLSSFEHPNPKLSLVITASAIKGTTTFYKTGERAGVVLHIPDEKPWEKEKSAHARVLAELQQEGKKMGGQALQFLIKTAGSDPASLHGEVEKLCIYVGEREEITVQDIRALTACGGEHDIFQLRDALLTGDGKTAFAIARELLQDGDLFFPVLRQLRSQIQTLAHLLAAHGNPGKIQELFPWMKGGILSRNLEMAKRMGVNGCREALLLIDATERKGKNSNCDVTLLFDCVIAKLLV